MVNERPRRDTASFPSEAVFWLPGGVPPADPQTFGVPPPPHVCGAVQVPQLIVPPHPSGIVPQLSGDGQLVSGVQPQTFGVPPPPHVWGAIQHVEPQIVPPVIGVPTQAPFRQMSFWVHGLPSLQTVPFGSGGLLHRPVLGLQVPAA
jgi:hypothetical protein